MIDFFEKYDHWIMPEPNSGCWIWLACRTTAGYGHFTRANRSHYAHRCAYEAAHGEGSASGLIVRHRCDFPPCCNPEHLLGGTHADNMQDAIDRGRANRAVGEAASKALLSEQDVRRARDMAAKGVFIFEMQGEFGISRNGLHSAVTGESWLHLGPGVTPPKYRGEACLSSKLKNAQVAEIKQRLAKGERQVDLAAAFDVSQSTISCIKLGRNWNWL